MKKNYPEEFLYWAGMSDEYIMELKLILFENPELINSTNKIGDNALTLAARMNNLKICKYLIQNTDINIYHENEYGNAIMNALHKRNIELAWFLIQNTDISLHKINSIGENVYFKAAIYGLDEFIDYFLENNVNINILNNEKKHCLFPLVEYFNNHQNGWCFELIQSNLPLETIFSKNKDGYTIINYMEKIIANTEEGIARRTREEQLLPLKNRLITRYSEEIIDSPINQ